MITLQFNKKGKKTLFKCAGQSIGGWTYKADIKMIREGKV